MKQKAPTTTAKQDKAVSRRYSGGDHPFTTAELVDEGMKQAVRNWLDADNLVGIVDESQGGIIGYVNAAHADRIAALLNAATL